MKKISTLARLRAVCTWEKVICRLIGAWCTVAMVIAFSEGNFAELAFAQDMSLGVMCLWMIVLFALYSAVAVVLPAYFTDSWFLFGAATVCVLRWLLTYEETDSTLRFQFQLAVIVAYALFAVYFVQRNTGLLDRFIPSRRFVTVFAMVCGVIGGAVIAVITCLRYATFSSPNFDFGLFCNMFYNMKETGLPLVTSERDVLLSHFVVHISPIYYLLLPFYFVFPSPLTLQIGQAVALASGVIPVLLLCRRFELSGKVTMLITALYAFYPALAAGCFYDIHENCFLPPLLLWMFYFFEKEKYLPMYLMALGVLLVKEDAAVYVVLFALYVLLSRRKYLHGAILAVASVIYFVVALAILQTASAYYAELYAAESASPSISGPMINRFNNLIADADTGLLGAIKTALANPGFLLTQLFSTTNSAYGGWGKVVYVLQMILPLGLIPFCTRKASRWLLVTPILLNLLTMYQYQYDIGFQYQFGITAFLIYSLCVNLPDLALPTRRNLLTVGAVACCCMYLITVIPKMNAYVTRWNDSKDTYRAMDAVLDEIPEDASLAVSTMVLAHVAGRSEVYEVSYHGAEPDVDYLILDRRYSIPDSTVQSYTEAGYVEVMTDQPYFLILRSPNAE